jgi:ABC-type transporter Mla maintaining outer membrane lipid asymmetry ATPase subunit MlaF
MIELRDVYKALGGHPVLQGVSLRADPGKVLCVIGRSGAGKSVLTRLAIGLLAPDAGEVWLLGRRIDGLSGAKLRRARRGAALVLQGAALLPWLTLRENVALPLRQGLGLRRQDALARADSALAGVGLTDEAAQVPSHVSAGARQRAAVARALALEPRAVLYDEPTTGLDPAAARQIDLLIRASADRGAAVLVVTHDMETVRRVANRTLELRAGQLGDPALSVSQ